MQLKEGHKLGHYRIICKLGKGGMGMVYRAEHEIIGNHVAIKVLHPWQCDNPEIVDRFQKEARAAGAIGHPGIVRVQDLGSSNGSAFIVMELLEGEDLQQRLERVKTLEVDDALVFSHQIASALAAAHDKNIVHRDLKPDNIMIVRDPDIRGGERIKLLDFGVAKLEVEGDAKTRAGLVLGTPKYMAPEQCWGTDHVDGRADLYSLGCVLYRVLCGRPPFTQKGARELLAAHLHSRPPRPSQFNAQIQPAVEKLMLDLLEKEPNRRVQSAVELMKRVEVLLSLERDRVNPTAEATLMETTIPFTRKLESLLARKVPTHRAGSLRSDGPSRTDDPASHQSPSDSAPSARGFGSAPSGFRTEPARPISGPLPSADSEPTTTAPPPASAAATPSVAPTLEVSTVVETAKPTTASSPITTTVKVASVDELLAQLATADKPGPPVKRADSAADTVDSGIPQPGAAASDTTEKMASEPAEPARAVMARPTRDSAGADAQPIAPAVGQNAPLRLPLPGLPPARSRSISDGYRGDVSLAERLGTISQLASVQSMPVLQPRAQRSPYLRGGIALFLCTALGLGVHLAVDGSENIEFAAAGGPETGSVSTGESRDGAGAHEVGQDAGPSAPHVRQADSEGHGVVDAGADEQDVEPDAAPEPAQIVVTIESTPTGAEIRDERGHVIGRTPFSGRIARDPDATRRWVLSISGFKRAPIEFSAGDDFSETLALTPERPRSVRPRPPKQARQQSGDGTLVNPFRPSER